MMRTAVRPRTKRKVVCMRQGAAKVLRSFASLKPDRRRLIRITAHRSRTLDPSRCALVQGAPGARVAASTVRILADLAASITRTICPHGAPSSA